MIGRDLVVCSLFLGSQQHHALHHVTRERQSLTFRLLLVGTEPWRYSSSSMARPWEVDGGQRENPDPDSKSACLDFGGVEDVRVNE